MNDAGGEARERNPLIYAEKSSLEKDDIKRNIYHKGLKYGSRCATISIVKNRGSIAIFREILSRERSLVK